MDIAVLFVLIVAATLAGLAVSIAKRSRRWQPQADGEPSQWSEAAKELGLTPSIDSASLTSYPFNAVTTLVGSGSGPQVKVELLEWQEGRGYLLKTRVTVAVMDDSRRPTAAPGDPAAAFARLRRMNVQVSDGLLCVEQHGEATDAEIVDVVQAMLAVCSDPGRASLEAIFQSGETEARADALRFLVAVRGYSACADALSMALDSRVEDVQLVAVAAIAKANDVAFLDRLLALAPGAPARLAASIAETIGRLGDPRGEPALLRLLSHQAEPVRLAAIRALGRLGTIHAVGPLLPLANGLLAVSVKGAARDAIASIQARLGDADAGRLSLLAEGPAEGGVSIASDEGALSLTPGDRKKE